MQIQIHKAALLIGLPVQTYIMWMCCKTANGVSTLIHLGSGLNDSETAEVNQERKLLLQTKMTGPVRAKNMIERISPFFTSLTFFILETFSSINISSLHRAYRCNIEERWAPMAACRKLCMAGSHWNPSRVQLSKKRRETESAQREHGHWKNR